ncbi:hypothetical protein VN12_25905 [Pirellula sp. SH-Sr6A]|uniref:hypothetical protein n=1 Tax=Pirellula sp. SH-Sr6A TaxID=1632865 RepID=UPI00078D3C02|nr:hypothetical protein [Pirellula sp. SH-Sr6A]AMV35553.1 hypothetical protein VN12_25905 [Pirellula sp. SH-Sr6A]
MAIISTCESCGSTLQVDDAYAGLQARCGMCNALYTVPHHPLAEPGSPSTFASSTPLPYSMRKESKASVSDDDMIELQPIESPGFAPVLSADSTIEQMEPTFWVKVPDGNVYGPVDARTLLSWAEQGRVNSTCEVNPNGSQLWLNFSVWRMQHSALSKLNNPLAGSSQAGSPNLFGDSFAAQPLPANQKPTTSSGQGLLVLSLGLISWFLCPTILGAPICSIITLILATNELKRIAEGRSPRSDRVMVLIGMWLAIGNMVLSAFFVLLFFVGLAA